MGLAPNLVEFLVEKHTQPKEEENYRTVLYVGPLQAFFQLCVIKQMTLLSFHFNAIVLPFNGYYADQLAVLQLKTNTDQDYAR